MSAISKLKRRLQIDSTVDYIAEDAPRWAVEPYIPIPNDDLVGYLIDRNEMSQSAADGFRTVCRTIGSVLHHRRRSLHESVEIHYAPLDPDRDTRLLRTHQENAEAASTNELSQRIHEVLEAAHYTPLARSAVESVVGQSSQWGVPLHVDFDVFEHLMVYARGDINGVRTLRRWQNLWRQEIVEVPIYQRVVVLFKLCSDCRMDDDLRPEHVHLRLFKNVPKQDVDMLLPGTRVRISWIDGTRILVPTLGGIGVTIWKIAKTALLVAALSLYTAVVLIALIAAAIGYVVRTVFSYLQTKNRYMLNMTRSLYYQKLDSNAGVLYRILEEAEQQEWRETVLAYFALLTAGEPMSLRRLKRRAERMVREAIAVEIDFKAKEAVEKLAAWNLVITDESGCLRTAPPDEALRRLDLWWDRQIRFKPTTDAVGP